MFPGTFVISAPGPPPETGKEWDEYRFWKDYAKIIKPISFTILRRGTRVAVIIYKLSFMKEVRV